MAHANNANLNCSATTFEKKPTTSSQSTEEVRVVTLSEYAQAAQCLSEAFATDDVARYFVDTDDMARYSEEFKYKLHCDTMRYMTAAHILKGVVTTIGPNYDAVALWMPPGKDMDDIWTHFRSGMWRLWYKMSREGKTRWYSELMPLLHDTKHAVMGPRDDDSYYLVYIGSKPSARGKGYARKLIESMLVKADAENRATYLESSAAANIPYYQRFGFVPHSDIALTRGRKPILLNIMVREPMGAIESSKSGKGAEQTVEVRELTGA